MPALFDLEAAQSPQASVPFWGFDDPFDVAEDYTNRGTMNPWDIVYFGGVRAPGIATVRARRASRRDVRTWPGASGAQITHLGPEPSEVDITLLIWTSAQWRSWQLLKPLIYPNPGKDGKSGQQAVEVVHPALQLYGLTSLYCLEMGVPEPSSPPGARTIALKFIEFRPERGGTVKQPTSAQTSLQTNINATADYAGTSTPAAAPSVTNTGP